MTTTKTTTSRWSAAAVSLALLSLAGCAGDATGPNGGAGDARIVTSTVGQDVDPDGYTLVVDSEESRAIGVNDTVDASALPPGRFVFELDDVAPNCEVDGSNPRSLRVRAGEMASTIFEVACEAREGDLEVTASTSGEDPDPDGYTVTIDEADPLSVDPNGTVTVAGLARGTHSVELGDVASNCSVQGENPRQVEVPGDSTGSTAFEVVCEVRTGDLEVSVSTSGEDIDPDGYRVVVDGDRSRAVDPNGTVAFADLEEGSHEVALEGLASNCTVQGENPRQVQVPGDGAGSTAFEVVCEARTGDLEVSVSTSGEDIDPDGYRVVVDGDRSRAVGPNGTVEFADLEEGSHEVVLEGLASNCSVQGESARTVEVPAGGTRSTAFEVECEAREGDLEVRAATSGPFADRDGYEVILDGDRSRSLRSNGSVTFRDIEAGPHEVRLTDVSPLCVVDGDNPREVEVSGGEKESTTFEVRCGFGDDDDEDDDEDDD